MDSDGNIMDIELLEGNVTDAYSTKEKEYDNLTLVTSPKNAKGEYTKTQQTVIYNYLLDDNTAKMVVVSIILALAGVIAGAGIYLKARSTIVKKRRESIEIQK